MIPNLPWRVKLYQSHIGIVDGQGLFVVNMVTGENVETICHRAQLICEAVNEKYINAQKEDDFSISHDGFISPRPYYRHMEE